MRFVSICVHIQLQAYGDYGNGGLDNSKDSYGDAGNDDNGDNGNGDVNHCIRST